MKKGIWGKIVDVFSNPAHWSYRDREEERTSGLNTPFITTGAAAVLLIGPELYKLHRAGHFAIMTAVGFAVFLAGAAFHVCVIHRALKKKLRYDKRTDFHSSGVAVLIAFACGGILYLRLKYRLW